MKSWKVAIALAAISLLVAFALAAAQEPVREFSQLDTRLKPGDTVWVTDAQGREVKGKITALDPDRLTLKAGGERMFPAADVRLVRERKPDSLLNGGLIGMGVGGGLVVVACVSGGASAEDWQLCAAGAVLYSGIGALIGLGIDALIPGKKLVVYRGPTAGGSSAARLSIAPLVTSRGRGVAVSFAY